MITPEVLSADPNQIQFEQLYRKFYDDAVRRGRKILGELESAEDAAQETFTKLWQQWLHMQVDPVKIGGWIKVTNTRECIDELRYRKRRPSIPLEEGQSHPLTEQGEEEVNRSILQEDIQTVIRRAPTREILALRLAVFGGVSMAEGADIMGTSVAAFKTNLHRARQRVRRELNGAYGQSV